MPAEVFAQFFPIVMLTCRELSGEAWTDEVGAAWTNVLGQIAELTAA